MIWPFKKQPKERDQQELERKFAAQAPKERFAPGLNPLQRKEFLDHSLQRAITDFVTLSRDGKKPISVGDAAPCVVNSVKLAHAFSAYLPDEVFSYYACRGFIGYPACAILKQHEMIDKVCTMPVKDAMAPDYFLDCQDMQGEDINNDGKVDEVDEDERTRLKRVSDKNFRIKDKVVQFSINSRTFGVAYAVPVVYGINYEYPFNIDGVKPNSYKGMSIIEPFWMMPELNASSTLDPLSLHYYEPTYYLLASGRRIHRSHVIKIIYCEVADTLKPTYFFGGVSLTQQIFRAVYAAERVADEAPYLAMTKRLLVVDANVPALVAGDCEELEQFEILSDFRDNKAVYFKNPGDQAMQIDTTLTDFDALLQTQWQRVAAIAKMPSTKLLGTSPKGFNATGEFEMKDYKQSLQDIEESEFIPLLERHYQLLTKSEFGREVLFDIKFNPIDQPTAKDEAELANLQAQELSTLTMANVIDDNEAREVLRNDESGRWSGLEERPDDYYETDYPPGGAGFEDDGNEANRQQPQGRGQDADFKEEDHPRDDDGKFGSGGGETGKSDKETSPDEKQHKIDSVKINFERDNILPGLNADDLEELGKTDKPVLLKKNVIERNLTRHPEIDKSEYNSLIGNALYNSNFSFPGLKDNYVNLVHKLDSKGNSLVLLEMAETNNKYEIVHIMKINDKNLVRMQKKNPG